MKKLSDFNIHVSPTVSGETRTTCPECSPYRKKKAIKCLAVDVAEGIWFCHHCGWSGSTKKGTEFQPDVKSVQQPKHYRKPEWSPSGKVDPVIEEWFLKRGITTNTLVRYDIQRKSVYMPQVEEEVTAVALPYAKDGEVVNVKYRSAAKDFRQEKNAEKIVYGYDDVNGQKVFGITEGEIDKLSFAEVGIFNTCSVPDGAPSVESKNYESKFSFLESLQPIVDAANKVYIATDMDEPGEKLAEELARRIGKHKCYRVNFPCKDANDTLQQFGREKLKDCWKKAEPYPISGIITVSDLRAETMQLYEKGIEKGASVGWSNIDRCFRLRLGQITVLTGVPGHGKSEFLDHLLVNVNQLHHYPIGIFSPEAIPVSMHIARFAAKLVQQPFSGEQRMHSDVLSVALDELEKNFFFVHPENVPSVTIDIVLDLLQQAVYRHGIKVAVLDPWNDLQHQRDYGKTETEYIGETLVKIRDFARRNNLHFFIVAHPTKMPKIKGETVPIPTAYDISGSANWYNKTDNGLTVYRKAKNEVLVKSWKIKLQPFDGTPGTETLWFKKDTKTYEQHQHSALVEGEREIVRDGDDESDGFLDNVGF